MKITSAVELDIFSGRPNPSWTLTQAGSDSLAERLAALPPTAPRELSTNLGYRGLIVTIREPAGEAIARVQEGIVQIARDAETSYLEDRHRMFERWLINTGELHVPTDIQQIVKGTFQ